MKVISGIYKGRKIEGYDIDGTRPTMDRVKESLFALIQDYLANSIVLDLFSGSGNLGIEALSQGASFAYLVDSNTKSIKTIKKNIESIGITNCKTIHADYLVALKSLATENIKLDIIFLDPPYKTEYIEKSLFLISKLDLLKSNGLIVCESNDLNKITFDQNYEILKERKYSDKWVVILKKI